MIIQKFLPIFISGLLLCGCASGAVNSSSEMETLYTEVSKAETEDFVSTIDKENCFLCGSNRPGIFDYYKKSGCIAWRELMQLDGGRRSSTPYCNSHIDVWR